MSKRICIALGFVAVVSFFVFWIYLHDTNQKNLLKNLYVPAKYSELCGSGERNKCPAFHFINGELPPQIRKDIPSKYANISLFLDESVTGTLDLENKGTFNITAVPFEWCSASCGRGVYIVQEKNVAEVIAIIDISKDHLDKIKIMNNKIRVFVNAPFFDDKKPYVRECFFQDNKLDGDLLKCDDIDPY